MNDTHEYKGYRIKIVQDSDPQSPDDCGDEGVFLVYDHRQFNVQRKGFEPKDIDLYLLGKMRGDLSKFEDYRIFPIEAYIHSGVSLSLFEGTKQCRWDSSVSGYILVKKDLLQNGCASIEEDLTAKEAKEYAEGLIETWNQYLSGEVYGYIVEKADCYFEISKPDLEEITNKAHGYINLEEFYNRAEENRTWTELDSCWGFYGDPDGYVLEEAKSIIDNYEKDV